MLCSKRLADPSYDVRILAIRALGHFRDPRAIAPIQKLILHPPRPIFSEDRHHYVDAVSAIGGAEAIGLLDIMVEGFRNDVVLERSLVHFGAPSSARAIWSTYLKDPIRENTGSDLLSIGYYDGLRVLAACADADLVREIRERLTTSKDSFEKFALESLVGIIQKRLNK